MTKTLTIITLFFATISFGQVTKENPYKNINGLMSVDSISWQDIVDGFSMSDRFGGYIYQLDSDMTFQKIDFDCVVRFKVDSGSWEIKNHNTVILKSNKQVLYFDIVKFDQFYFFILPTQRQTFITDLKLARIKLKKFLSMRGLPQIFELINGPAGVWPSQPQRVGIVVHSKQGYTAKQWHSLCTLSYVPFPLEANYFWNK